MFEKPVGGRDGAGPRFVVLGVVQGAGSMSVGLGNVFDGVVGRATPVAVFGGFDRMATSVAHGGRAESAELPSIVPRAVKNNTGEGEGRLGVPLLAE